MLVCVSFPRQWGRISELTVSSSNFERQSQLLMIAFNRSRRINRQSQQQKILRIDEHGNHPAGCMPLVRQTRAFGLPAQSVAIRDRRQFAVWEAVLAIV